MPRLIALVVCLAAAFTIFFLSATTPTPLTANAPASVFSAGRAMVDIAAMASVPHPTGSPANARVRDYLVARLTRLGLSPQVQRDESHDALVFRGRRGARVDTQSLVAGADVENIVAILPGRDRALPALTLMAHYDSVAGSPGAADDITSVASILEMVRAIKASGTPARDVMVVFTDGEELGLLGARAFFAHNPMARHVGFVLNMEARGGGGLVNMFETGPGDGPAVDLYGATARRPASTSLSVFIYKLLPNDTDFTVAKAKGLGGFNYAFIGRQFDYHSPSSTVAQLGQGSVQHMGDQILPTARVLAFGAALPARGPDKVYGDLLGLVVVAYPTWVGWLALIAAGLMTGVGAWRAGRIEPIPWRDVLKGVGAALLVAVGGALALHLTRHATGAGFGWMEQRPILARFPLFEIAMAAGGLGAILLIASGLAGGRARIAGAGLCLAAGVAASLFGGIDIPALVMGAIAAVLALLLLGRPTGLAGTWTGLLIGALIAATALQILAPTTALVIAWPLKVAALASALTAAGASRRRIPLLLALVAMVLGLAWVGGLFHSLMQGLDLPEAPAFALMLIAMTLWPLAWPAVPADPWRHAPGAAALAVGLAVALFMHWTSPWSPRHPDAAEPLYVVDPAAGKAWRASPIALDPWSRSVLTADGGKIGLTALPGLADRIAAAPARPVTVTPPTIGITHAADGTVTLRAVMAPDAALRLDLTCNTLVTDTRVNGKPTPILIQPGQWSHLRWRAAPEGVTASFKVVGPGRLDLRYAESLDRWPAGARPPPAMPADVMAWDMAGSTVVVGTQHLAW